MVIAIKFPSEQNWWAANAAALSPPLVWAYLLSEGRQGCPMTSESCRDWMPHLNQCSHLRGILLTLHQLHQGEAIAAPSTPLLASQ